MNKVKQFSFKNLTVAIQGYGYKYSLKNYFLNLFLFYLAIAIAGLYFKLGIEHIIVIFIVAFICFPFIVIAQFRYLYNNRKFENLVGYLEQMIFSFKKTPKILDCLKTTKDIVDDEVAVHIQYAINIIENDNEGTGYSNAFEYLETKYHCSRAQALHSFMLSVEENGGKYQHALDVLLEDIRQWISRTYGYQKELGGVKGKIALSVILSLMIAGTMMVMVPGELVEFGNNQIYLMTTTVYFVVLILLFVVVQVKLNGEWLIDDRVEYLYEDIPITKKSTKSILMICLLTSPIFGLGLYMNSPFIISVGVLCFALIYIKPILKKWKVIKNRKKSIQKAFPFWLRDISLQIQTLVVPLAIKESIHSAPDVLIEPLKKLISEIEEKPDSITPYNNFLKEYEITDITNAMKMLYSIQTLHVRDIQIQLTALIKRNQELLERAERLQNEDTLAGIGFIMAIPMLFATFKLLVDLALILFSFMNLTSVI